MTERKLRRLGGVIEPPTTAKWEPPAEIPSATGAPSRPGFGLLG
jgi:hypothetical protein